MKLINQMPFDKITVKDIVESCSFALKNRKGVYHIYNSLSRRKIDNYLYQVMGRIMYAFVKKQAEDLPAAEEDVVLISDFYKCAFVGLIKLTGYFSRDLYRLAFQFDFAIGILSIVIGIMFLLHANYMIQILPTVMGILILVDGVFKMQTSLDARRFGLPSWWVILLLAAAASLCGLLLIWKPFEGAVAMTMLLGASFLVDGVENVWLALYTIKSSREDVIDVEYKEW